MLLSAINPINLFSGNSNVANIELTSKVENQDSSIPVQNEEEANLRTNHANPQRSEESVLEIIIEMMFKIFSNFLHIIGPFFFISLVCFVLFTYISIIKTIIPYFTRTYSPSIGRGVQVFATIQIIYILINYCLAVIVRPGSVADLKKSKYYQSHDMYHCEQLELPKFEANKDYEIRWKKCKHCKEVKPLRTHHCSICNQCVMKMDHHCPWINNCIGQNNHRYFLLFLYHLLIYALITAILSLIMIFNGQFSSQKNEFRFISILSIVGVVILILFNSWNWYLALIGQTTLEFWADKSGMNSPNVPSNYSLGSYKKNLFYVFGTENPLRFLYLPSIKKLPFSGLEWSSNYDSNFFIN